MTFEDNKRLERAVSMACEEIPDINPEMLAKILRLGRIVTNLRKENEDI